VEDNLFGTLTLPLQLRKWLASKPSKIKQHDLVQDSDTTVHGGSRQLEKAIGHEISNLQSEKQSFQKTNLEHRG